MARLSSPNQKSISFAYKSLHVDNGVILLFEKVRPFREENIRVTVVGEDLLLEFGNNVMLLTEKMLRHLIKTQHLFFYECPPGAYEGGEVKISLSTDQATIGRVQGAWDILKNKVPSSG